MIYFACIIKAFSLMQLRSIELRRYNDLFQGVRNLTDTETDFFALALNKTCIQIVFVFLSKVH
jgi:hypothetical protein